MLHFPLQVQFGHAGACANQASETAVAKNKALKEAGAFVPKSFDELGEIIKSVHAHELGFFFFLDILMQQFLIKVLVFFRSVYDDLVAKGVIQPAEEVPPPTVPMDYSWARVSMPESTT